jgi:flagellar biosynthesis/type III secretory pathway chaperone
MSLVKHLEEVMSTEAELTEALIDVMKQQQQALISINASALAESVEKEEELSLPIEGLEQERIRLTNEIVRSADAITTFSQLLAQLSEEESARLKIVGKRLRKAIEQVTRINYANKFLIDHSRRFVHETVKIITGSYSKQLVDQKV